MDTGVCPVSSSSRGSFAERPWKRNIKGASATGEKFLFSPQHDSDLRSKLDRVFEDAPLKARSVKRRPEQRELEIEKHPKRHKTNKSSSPSSSSAPSHTRRVEPIMHP
ncbi:hypothetical protein K443DRAFT_473542 [Laccaria amethystina LaAM-08-1]|uniref:Uncharacterized protein n=1 Tax=Laccaria amethystina LaAM-08-1 TaxID=1095629 RepID=A0A0C9Y0P8_9AGAR|nr:hypothetical protein K443DRAFT_473542 [Laccaria amethystina LaAM-08-1]